MATAPESAPTADPAVIAAMHRRRRGRRLRSAAILGLILAVVGAAAFQVGRQMVATTWLMIDHVEVDWTLDGESWRKGGVTHVFSFARSQHDTENMPPPKLKLLGWLYRVETLDLSEIPGIRDEDLVVLDRLDALVSLRLDRPGNLPTHLAGTTPRLTDATLARLRGMKDLGDLSLAGQEVTDAGLEALTGLARLETLNLEGNGITDAGLEPLKRIKGLKSVRLVGTKVTAQAAHDFEVARPGVMIVIKDENPDIY